VELDLHSHIYLLGVDRNKLDVVKLDALFGQKQLLHRKDIMQQ
jgi:DNA helicase TIP49 (TBP-interacting protein)